MCETSGFGIIADVWIEKVLVSKALLAPDFPQINYLREGKKGENSPCLAIEKRGEYKKRFQKKTVLQKFRQIF